MCSKIIAFLGFEGELHSLQFCMCVISATHTRISCENDGMSKR